MGSAVFAVRPCCVALPLSSGGPGNAPRQGAGGGPADGGHIPAGMHIGGRGAAPVIDFLLGLYFAALAVRGWLRGLVREGMDLLGLIVGLAVAFRLSGWSGAWIAKTFGVSGEVGRVVGGIGLFLLAGVAASVAAHYLRRLFGLPGLGLTSRVLGSGMALAWALFLSMLILSMLVVLPLPGSFDRHMSESKVAGVLTDPGSPPQLLFQFVAGDRVLEALLNLERSFGREKVIADPDETLAIPPADPGDLQADEAVAAEIFELLNRARIDTGLDPLAWSGALARVGEGHAREMYVLGYFSHTSPSTGTVGDRTQAAGIPYRFVGENLALAATSRTVHEGLMDSPSHRANILNPAFTRVGIGVVRGPLGLMAVQVFSG